MSCFCLLVWLVVVFVCLFVYLLCLFTAGAYSRACPSDRQRPGPRRSQLRGLRPRPRGMPVLTDGGQGFGGGEGRGGENVRPTSARVDFLHGVEAKTSKIVTIACLLRRKVKMRISGPKSTKFARRLGETPRSEIRLEIFSQK